MNFLEKYGNVELRALNWKQPFASLMLHGKIETRVWDTKYRGWVLICASKSPYKSDEICHISSLEGLNTIVKTVGGLIAWPLGEAIAIGRLVDSRFMLKSDQDKCFVKYHEPWLHTSKKTGKKSWKRLWCHVYEDVQPIEPIVRVGSQGWTKLGDYYKSQIILL